MIITTSNILLGRTPIVITGASSDSAANLSDPDFSTIYRSSDPLRLTYQYVGNIGVINYVAVAGINIGAGIFENPVESSRVRVYDNDTLIKTVNVIRDNCVVLYFEARSFQILKIGLKNSANINPICTFTAAGLAFEVPNGGEQAGYNRQGLNRPYTQKTTTNAIAAPVSTLTKSVRSKGALSIPNTTLAFSEVTWQNFLDFSRNNYFFIQEKQNSGVTEFFDLNESSYLCYDISKNKVTAHPQTRKLNNISISFSVYNGL